MSYQVHWQKVIPKDMALSPPLKIQSIKLAILIVIKDFGQLFENLDPAFVNLDNMDTFLL